MKTASLCILIWSHVTSAHALPVRCDPFLHTTAEQSFSSSFAKTTHPPKTTHKLNTCDSHNGTLATSSMFTFGMSCGYILSRGGSFGGFSLRLPPSCCCCWACSRSCSRVAATPFPLTKAPFPFIIPGLATMAFPFPNPELPPELPPEPPPLPATL